MNIDASEKMEILIDMFIKDVQKQFYIEQKPVPNFEESKEMLILGMSYTLFCLHNVDNLEDYLEGIEKFLVFKKRKFLLMTKYILENFSKEKYDESIMQKNNG